MDITLWLLFLGTFTSALAIPGANAAYAIAQTISHGPKNGITAALGFGFATGLSVVLVMTGLGILLSQSMEVLTYMKWLGISYLLFMAYKAFTAQASSAKTDSEVKKSKVFMFAVLISLSNPKVILFNTMLIPLFLDSEKSILGQGAIITATAMVLSFLVYSAYALFASRFISKLKTTTANKVVGSAYTCAAGALASINN